MSKVYGQDLRWSTLSATEAKEMQEFELSRHKLLKFWSFSAGFASDLKMLLEAYSRLRTS